MEVVSPADLDQPQCATVDGMTVGAPQEGSVQSTVLPMSSGSSDGSAAADPEEWAGLFARTKARPSAFYARCAETLAAQDLYEPGDLGDLALPELQAALKKAGATAGMISFLEQAHGIALADAGKAVASNAPGEGRQSVLAEVLAYAPEEDRQSVPTEVLGSSPAIAATAATARAKVAAPSSDTAEEARRQYLATPRPSPSRTLEFPTLIGPFTMSRANLANAFNSFYGQHSYIPKPDPTSSENSMAGLDPAAVQGLGIVGEIIFCQLSPLHEITLDDETKAAANIPQQCRYFAWAYPAVLEPVQVRSLRQGAESAFLEYGGYIYVDDAQSVVGTNSICPASLDTLGLMFGRAQMLPESVCDSLTKQGRFQEITLDALRSKGATHFSWVRPLEFEGQVACPNGCFAYRFADGAPRYYPVVDKPVFTREMLNEELEDTEAWVVVRVARRVEIEKLVIFDKTVSLEENLANQAGEVLGNGASLSVRLGKDSFKHLALTWQEWSELPDVGTIQEPWIVLVTYDATMSA